MCRGMRSFGLVPAHGHPECMRQLIVAMQCSGGDLQLFQAAPMPGSASARARTHDPEVAEGVGLTEPVTGALCGLDCGCVARMASANGPSRCKSPAIPAVRQSPGRAGRCG